PLLHGIFTVWRDERRRKGSSTARQNLSVAVGRYLHTLLVRQKLLTAGDIPGRQRMLSDLSRKPQRNRRKKGEPPRKRGRRRNRDARNLTFYGWLAQMGDWLIGQAMALPCFTYDHSRKPYLPAIAPQWMKPQWINRILTIKRYFIGLDAQQLP